MINNRSKINNYFTDKKLSSSTQVIPVNTSFKENNQIDLDLHTVFIHNRKTHSELVAKVAEQLIKKWKKFNILSYEKQEDLLIYLYDTCMLHDIGQPSYGHELADIMDKTLEKYNNKLFFDDNSNNLIFLEMYNLKKILKTLGINYKENIQLIDEIINTKNERLYFSKIYRLFYKKYPVNNQLEKFIENLKEENEELVLDKKLFCYLIKRPQTLSRKLNIKKGLYPYLHSKYIPYFFKLKKEEKEEGLEISGNQLNVTWFMDMSDEIAYISGDFTNFLNLYYNLDNFRKYIKEEYPEKYLLINSINKQILENCNFPFIKKIDKHSDFKMIENKLIKYFIDNIDIKNKIYGNDIKELFVNDKAYQMFENIRYINYNIYIEFIKKNVKKEFGQRKDINQKSQIFLNDIYTKITKEGKLPRVIKNNIYSDLYKNLINYSISTKNSNRTMLYFTNYVAELNIQQFDILITKYFEDKENKLKNIDKKNEEILLN